METMRTQSPTTVDPGTRCCPPFDPEPWNERELQWQDKAFVRAHVRSLFHLPLNMNRQVLEANAKIEAAHAQSERPLMLSDEASPWRSELYIEVAADVPGDEMAHLSGTYLTKVFEGPYRQAPKWMDEMKRFVESRGKRIEKLLFGYTMCPACAKAYGKNYVVLFARVT